jgi:hypothetical protein
MAPLPSARWHRVVMCGRSQKCWEHLGTLWWRGLFGGKTRVPMGILLGHWRFLWDRWEQNVFITKIRDLDRGCFCTIFPMDMRNRWNICACFWFLKQTIEPNIWYITKWVYKYCIYIYCTYIYIVYICIHIYLYCIYIYIVYIYSMQFCTTIMGVRPVPFLKQIWYVECSCSWSKTRQGSKWQRWWDIT